MSYELEKSLRSALRPVDPGEEFTHGVLARIDEEKSHRSASSPMRYAHAARLTFRRASVTLALVVTAGLFTAHQWQAHRTQQGLEARRQLVQALQVTAENLDIAYRMVNNHEGSR